MAQIITDIPGYEDGVSFPDDWDEGQIKSFVHDKILKTPAVSVAQNYAGGAQKPPLADESPKFILSGSLSGSTPIPAEPKPDPMSDTSAADDADALSGELSQPADIAGKAMQAYKDAPSYNFNGIGLPSRFVPKDSILRNPVLRDSAIKDVENARQDFLDKMKSFSVPMDTVDGRPYPLPAGDRLNKAVAAPDTVGGSIFTNAQDYDVLKHGAQQLDSIDTKLHRNLRTDAIADEKVAAAQRVEQAKRLSVLDDNAGRIDNINEILSHGTGLTDELRAELEQRKSVLQTESDIKVGHLSDLYKKQEDQIPASPEWWKTQNEIKAEHEKLGAGSIMSGVFNATSALDKQILGVYDYTSSKLGHDVSNDGFHEWLMAEAMMQGSYAETNPTALADFSRGVGGAAALLLGPSGKTGFMSKLANTSQMTVRAMAESYEDAKLQGASESEAAAAGGKSAIDLAAFMIGGQALGKIMSKWIAPNAGLFTKTAGSFATQAAANSAMSAALRGVHGGELLPNARELGADLAFAGHHASDQYMEGGGHDTSQAGMTSEQRIKAEGDKINQLLSDPNLPPEDAAALRKLAADHGIELNVNVRPAMTESEIKQSALAEMNALDEKVNGKWIMGKNGPERESPVSDVTDAEVARLKYLQEHGDNPQKLAEDHGIDLKTEPVVTPTAAKPAEQDIDANRVPLARSDRRALRDRAQSAVDALPPIERVHAQRRLDSVEQNHQELRRELEDAKTLGQKLSAEMELVEQENRMRRIAGEPELETSRPVTEAEQKANRDYLAKRITEVEAKIKAGEPLTKQDRGDWVTGGRKASELPKESEPAPTAEKPAEPAPENLPPKVETAIREGTATPDQLQSATEQTLLFDTPKQKRDAFVLRDALRQKIDEVEAGDYSDSQARNHARLTEMLGKVEKQIADNAKPADKPEPAVEVSEAAAPVAPAATPKPAKKSKAEPAPAKPAEGDFALKQQAASRTRSRKLNIPPAPNDTPDIIDTILGDHGKIKSRNQARLQKLKAEGKNRFQKTQQGGEYDGWNDLPPRLKKLLIDESGGGTTPDVMADNVGMEGDSSGLREKLIKAWEARLDWQKEQKRIAREEKAAEPAMRKQEKREQDFKQASGPESSDPLAFPIEGKDLKPGDDVVVEGETLKVTDVDEEGGTVTLEGGDRFGTQRIDTGDTIYGDHIKGEGHAEKPAEPVVEKPAEPTAKKPAKPSDELLGDETPFNLTAESPAEKAAREAAAEADAKAKADEQAAKDKAEQDKLQGDMFSPKSISDEAPKTPLHPSVVSRVVASLRARFKGSADTRVIADGEQYPDAVKERARKRGVELNKIGGLLHDGVVWLNAAALHSPERAAEVFFHEQAGHVGVDALLDGLSPKASSRLMDALRREFPAELKYAEKWYEPNEHLSEALARIMEKFGPKSDATPKDQSRWRRIVDFIRNILVKSGIKKWSRNDIEALLRRGIDKVRRGDGKADKGETRLSIEEGDNEESGTSNKEEVVNQELHARGKNPIEKEAAISNEKALEYGRAKLKENPGRASEIIAGLKNGTRMEREISLEKGAVLLAHRRELTTKYHKALERMSDKGASQIERAAASVEAHGYETALSELDQAAQDARSTWGGFGQFWKQQLKEDYTFTALKRKLSAAKGEDTSKEEDAGLRDVAAKHKEAFEQEQKETAQLEELRRTKAESEELKKQLDEAKAEVADERTFTKGIREKYKASIQQKSVSRKVRGLNALHLLLAKKGIKFSVEDGEGSFAEKFRDAISDVGAGILGEAEYSRPQFEAKMREILGDNAPKDMEQLWKDSREKLSSDIQASIEQGKKRDAAKGKPVVDEGDAFDLGERDIESERDATTAALAEKAKEGLSKPQLRRYVTALSRGFIKEGITEIEPLTDALHAEVKKAIPDITRTEVRDAFSGFGDWKKLSTDPDEVLRQQLVSEAQTVSKIEKVMQGEAPPKTGRERAEQRPQKRELEAKYKKLAKERGIVATDPARQLKSSMDAIKTRLKNEIEDLDHALATRERRVSRDKTSPQYDAEAKALKEQRDAKKAEYDKMFPKEPITEEQQLKRATVIAERNKEAWDKRLEDAKNGVFPDTKKEQGPINQRIQHLRDMAKAAKAEYEHLRDLGNPEKSDVEKAISARYAAALRRIADLAERRRNEDFAPRPKKPEPVATTVKEKAAMAKYLKAIIAKKKIELKFLQDKEAYRLKNRSKIEKTFDGIAKWNRAFVLTGFDTLKKLTSAAAMIIGIAPIEQGLGAAASRLIPKAVRDNAPTRSQFSVNTEIKAVSETFRHLFKDAGSAWKTGSTELDALYGNPKIAPHELLDYIGNLHYALKTPAARNEWHRHFEYDMKHEAKMAAKRGETFDPLDPATQLRSGIKAYKASKRSIFSEENIITEGYEAALSRWGRKKNPDGTPKFSAQAMRLALRFTMPIVKIPTNIVARTFEYGFGHAIAVSKMGTYGLRGVFAEHTASGEWKLREGFRKGLESMSPEMADSVVRNIARGSLGTALLLVGFANPQAVGGYYSKNRKKEDGELDYGTLEVFGHKIPKVLIHNPLLEQLQIGATIRKVADSFTDKTQSEQRGLGAGVKAAMLGLSEQTPFVREAGYIGALQDDNKSAQLLADQYGRVVPQGVKELAAYLDTDKNGDKIVRKPQSQMERFKMNIPWLRQQVPEKEEKLPAARLKKPSKVK